MKKSRFLLNLITVTAVGLSVLGCDSSNSGVISDASDVTQGGNQDMIDQRRNLREYMIVGVRGLEKFAPSFSEAQSAPKSDPPLPLVAQPGDGNSENRANLYELTGIADLPVPNLTLTGPGGGADPTFPTVPDDRSGFHEVVASPNGDFAILISRAHNRGLTVEDIVQRSTLQIFSLNYAAPLDVTFPPSIEFDVTAAGGVTYAFSAPQGEFASGAWSSNAQQFYASLENSIIVYAVNGLIGELDPVQSVNLPAGVASIDNPGMNNAVKMIVSADGKFLYAMDNANSQILSYSRNSVNGFLTQIATTPTVGDPRGMSLERGGRFLYVTGRSSLQLAGYQLGADGSLTEIDLLAGNGIGPLNLGTPLGDVDANPQADQLFVASYDGALQAYTINPLTGQLKVNGPASSMLGTARNTGNIEVEPTGRFVIAANGHDYDTYEGFGGPNYANINKVTNDPLSPDFTGFFSMTPMFDKNGRVVYVNPLPDNREFTGDIQVFRIQNDGTPRPSSSTPVTNPYGLSFFQKVVTPPAGKPGDIIQP